MQNLIDSLERFISIDEDKLWVDTIRKLERFITDLNTKEQLFLGINADVVKLENIGGSYEESTIKRKRRKGQPTDRVTLKDTSDFYKSFKVVEDSTGFRIVADFFKGTFDLRFRWGGRLAGLTPKNEQRLKHEIIKEYKKQILKIWKGT